MVSVPRVLLVVPSTTYRAADFLQAAATLGIDVAVATDAIPEITSVMDVTDHSLGENPYYEPAKK